MPLQIVRADITRMAVDAIVNAANTSLLGGGGVDGCIHRAAGPRLLEACKRLGGCPTGSAKATKAFNLPAEYVIHAVGPVWQGGIRGEERLLRSCYRRALELAYNLDCKTVAFPLISAGAYRYPREQALHVAMDEIGKFLMEHDLVVYIVIYDGNRDFLSPKRMSEIESYIDENYVDARSEFASRKMEQIRRERPIPMPRQVSRKWEREEECDIASTEAIYFFPEEPEPPCSAPVIPDVLYAPGEAPDAVLCDSSFSPSSLESLLDVIDESFSEMLLRKIDERQMKDSYCYKKANIDRKLFSKIRSDKHYKPSKPTVLAFAIALELPLWETKEMLMKAGFALSHSNKFDIIVEYFIQNGNYNIYEINEALFTFDQSLLGN